MIFRSCLVSFKNIDVNCCARLIDCNLRMDLNEREINLNGQVVFFNKKIGFEKLWVIIVENYAPYDLILKNRIY